ncbi:homogentisate phytyltransferase [Anabaena aphanizomenioides LEGE 00250]|uniref:Homogentisate phytyltransferase n=1 Tax=Sphaerospermopsis aphanizomenoides LEGE 00250 TaxID=2777972 RepID=A0ABR9VG02_9CYAN|nr:homogentisate phytyltransferase [Sphaerospermopsis aphanizomenoides]MBE9237125.1 homogentisate phytyltransferase [Sphaerospermopsis aphanizomenoides LEGE 00250]
MNQFFQQNLPIFPGSWLYAFWKFSRPHTIIGTSLSVFGLYLLTLGVTSTSFSVVHLGQIFGTWLACIAGNIYIVGLNQLQDVDIDKINKPHLPLASGEFSREQGTLIVVITGILALVVAWLNGPYLLGMVGISLLIGTAYSLPPIRLKQFPFWAALCIFSVRGTIVNLGLFLHFSWLFQRSQGIPSAVWVLTAFILVFTFAIAIFKDIPDLEGDKLYNITTFTIQLGQRKVFKLALWVLTVCYLGMMFVGIFRLAEVNPIFLFISHLIPLVLIWRKSQKVDLQNKSEIAQFYQFIWKLFFIEYLIFPIAAILA